jgi:hypothetical protein
MKGKQMKDKDLFQKIEQFDDYPIGYESNVNTQRRLIEDLLNSSNSNIRTSNSNHYKYAIAVFSAALVSIIIFFSIHTTEQAFKQPMQLASIHKEIDKGKPLNVSGIKSAKTISKRSVAIELDTAISNLDTGKTIVYQPQVLAVYSDTNVPQKEITLKVQPKLFAKRQRFKQFDFEANVIVSPIENSKRKLEFFVFKDGQFKIILRNKNQSNVIHFE